MNPSERVILRPVFATRSKITVEPINMIISRISKLFGVIVPKRATGRPRTMQILKILLPTMLPTRRSVSPRLEALMVVISSGRDVPKAMIVRAMMRSEIPTAVAILEAELTTNSAPPTTPTRPTMVRRKEIPSLYCGFSTSFLDLRFLRAVEIM